MMFEKELEEAKKCAAADPRYSDVSDFLRMATEEELVDCGFETGEDVIYVLDMVENAYPCALCGEKAVPEYGVGSDPYCSAYCAAATGAEPWEPGDILEAWQGLKRNLADNGGKASLAFYLAYWQAASALAEASGLAVPSAEALESALVDNLTKGEFKRYLKRSRSEAGDMFGKWLSWHNSGGNLHGPISWAIFRRAESEPWENLTAADVAFRKRIGAGGSRALSAWEKALGGTI